MQPHLVAHSNPLTNIFCTPSYVLEHVCRIIEEILGRTSALRKCMYNSVGGTSLYLRAIRISKFSSVWLSL